MRDTVWLFVVFDLPSMSKDEKRAHAKFRNSLLRRGLLMLQWSMYARAYPSEAASESDRNAITASVPRGGRVRMLVITDHVSTVNDERNQRRDLSNLYCLNEYY